MTATFRKFALPCLLGAWFLTPAASHAAGTSQTGTCASSLASLNGWYALLISGATLGSSPGPKYLAGALLFDGAGGISANNVYSGAGLDNTAAGSYVLNADCTLTLTLTIGSTAAQSYTVAVEQSNEAVGIEVDASAVATIDLRPQYAKVTTGLNFTSTSMNGTYAGKCIGPAGGYSDLNIVTFANGALHGTDPYNNSGTFAVANNPYSGTYTINTDGTFSGSLTVDQTQFYFYGVISNSSATVQYIYDASSNGSPTLAFQSCLAKSSAPIAYPIAN